jgi:hypothetical protein
LNIELGTVFRWNNFPFPKYGGEEKARWFICIGFSGIFAQVAVAYLCTTTTHLQQFGPAGKRKNHDHFKFSKDQFPIFEQDCVVDFDAPIYDVEIAKIDNDIANIEIKGKLAQDTMRMVYKRFLRSPFLSPVTLRDIYDSFNKAGITGLLRPKASR